MKKIFLFFVFSGIVTFMLGQNLSIYMNEGPRGTQHKLANEDFYRMSFRISGLADNASVQNFVSNCKSFPGIVDVSVKEMDKTGQRPVLIKFDTKKNEEYLKSFLKHAGVSKIYSQNKEYTPDNLSALKQDRKNTLGTSKPGLKQSQK